MKISTFKLTYTYVTYTCGTFTLMLINVTLPLSNKEKMKKVRFRYAICSSKAHVGVS